jgi:hypothetical protein
MECLSGRVLELQPLRAAGQGGQRIRESGGTGDTGDTFCTSAAPPGAHRRPAVRGRPLRPRSLRAALLARQADDLTYAMPACRTALRNGTLALAPMRGQLCHVLVEVEFGGGPIVRAGVLLAHRTGALLGSPPLLWPGGVITADPRSFRRPLLCPCCSRAAAHPRPFQDHYVSPRMVKGLSMERAAHRVASVTSVRPARRSAPMARLRGAAMALGPERVLTRDLSSW